KGGPKRRVSSPLPGRSILITSAPRSPRIWVQKGPARMRVRSRTVMPASGPVVSVIRDLLARTGLFYAKRRDRGSIARSVDSVAGPRHREPYRKAREARDEQARREAGG